MTKDIIGTEIKHLIQLLGRLPGLGSRSARRVALHLIKNKQQLLVPLHKALAEAMDMVTQCSVCGNIDCNNPCAVCSDQTRDKTVICVVEEVGDLWALERAAIINCQYHVIGGTLSALDGIGPDDLNITNLINRVNAGNIKEVIIAINATIDGQTTAHYIMEHLGALDVKLSRLAHGVPVGGELDYLDEGTIAAAMEARRFI